MSRPGGPGRRPCPWARRAVDFGLRLGVADKVKTVGIIVEAVARAEEHAVVTVRERDDAAAAEPADAIERGAGRVLETARRADVGEVDAVLRRGDADGDDIIVRLSHLAGDDIGKR